MFTIIFYYVTQRPPDLQWRNREKRIDKEHHELLHTVYVIIYMFTHRIILCSTHILQKSYYIHYMYILYISYIYNIYIYIYIYIYITLLFTAVLQKSFFKILTSNRFHGFDI